MNNLKKYLFIILGTLLLSACSNDVVEISSEALVDNSITDEQIISEMVSKMTVKDKIEQMLVLDYSTAAYGKEGEKDVTKLSDTVKETIASHNIGGIILFRDNTKGTQQTLELVSDFQESATTNNKKYQIPLFMCIDQEGGRVTRLATGTSLPGNMALGAINDSNTTKEYASIVGKEISSLGFNVNFAPVLDVNNNPSNPVIGVRSFSSDPYKVAKMGEAFIEGLHSENIASTLKHFPGHGDTATDSHTGLPLINKTYEEIKSVELIPFKSGIDKGADMIMTAHIVYPQIEKTTYISKKNGEEITLPATLSKTILTDILRNDLGFNGVIVTDALNMGAIAEHFEKIDVVRYALNAGVDILLMPISLANDNGELDAYINTVVNLVQNGEIPEENINKSVTRILKLKQKMGLLDENNSFELTNDKIQNALKVVGSEEHHNKEFQIAKKAITLVKGQELLPINKSEKVLFLNSYENEKNSVEYAIEKLKEDNILDDSFKYEIDSFEGKEFAEIKEKVNDASIVVVLADTVKNAYFNNENKDGWQGRFIDKAIEEAHAQNKKVIIVSCMLPYDAFRYTDADVIVCAYGDRIISNLPIEYNGETETFGANITAAIVKLFSNEEFIASMPVDK